jgi:hypothetical protein
MHFTVRLRFSINRRASARSCSTDSHGYSSCREPLALASGPAGCAASSSPPALSDAGAAFAGDKTLEDAGEEAEWENVVATRAAEAGDGLFNFGFRIRDSRLRTGSLFEAEFGFRQNRLVDRNAAQREVVEGDVEEPVQAVQDNLERRICVVVDFIQHVKDLTRRR